MDSEQHRWNRDLLASLAMFQELDAPSMDDLATLVEGVHLPGGRVLMSQGDPGEVMYVVARGRLRAFVRRADGQEVAVGDVAAGEIVGEMALLTEEPRAATIRALRDSHLLSLSRAAFQRLMRQHPDALVHVTRIVIARLHRTLNPVRHEVGRKSLAIVPAGSTILQREDCEMLVTHLAQHGKVALIGSEDVDSALGRGVSQSSPGDRGDSELIEWLHEVEIANRFVLYRTDQEARPWSERCLRQSDQVLLVGDASAEPSLNALERHALDSLGSRVSIDGILVLLHEAAHHPHGTEHWLEHRSVDTHFHVRRFDSATHQRLARFLAGQAVGVVLSGGGARGFAHLGVLRALQESGVPIDFIGGSSFGASVASAFAMGWDHETILEQHLRVTLREGSILDFTFPAIAMTRGARLTHRMRAGFGEAQIEDLWYGLFCVSSDLSAGRPYVHRRGPVWQAVRASVGLPGIFPPVRSPEGSVLVDGSLTNALPTDVMRKHLGGGRVIAVLLRAPIRFNSEDLPSDGIVSGWRVWLQRMNPFQVSPRVPPLVRLLAGASMMGSTLSLEAQQQNADLLLTPPVEGIDLLGFGRYREAIDAGYRHTMSRIEEWQRCSDPGGR